MKTTTRAMVAITMAAGLAAGAKSVRADQVPLLYAGPATGEATVRAEELEREARTLFSQPKAYGRAAKLLQKAAAERVPGDPVRVKDLQLASRLVFYRGDEWKALDLMTQAANEALSSGDVISAAHHFADAAFLAKEGKRPAEAKDLAARAAMLAGSPLIDSKAREAILARVQA
jgi:hypothetical protein